MNRGLRACFRMTPEFQACSGLSPGGELEITGLVDTRHLRVLRLTVNRRNDRSGLGILHNRSTAAGTCRRPVRSHV